jgi:FkbM family methyltransferase
MNNNFCIFSNDNYVKIYLPDHPFSDKFSTRDNHEVVFRKIHTIMIKNKLINGNIIDLGCWVGDNSLPWAKNIDGIVFAIDPSLENCHYIKQLVEINGVNNIKVIQEVVSDEIKVVSTNDDLSHATFVSNNSGLTKLTSTTLDKLFEQNEIFGIDYIHLDVEAMEFQVVKGSEKIITHFQPIITFEQHLNQDDYISLSSHLKKRGYLVFLINEVLPGCNPDCRNFIAFPSRISFDKINKDLIEYIGKPELFTII